MAGMLDNKTCVITGTSSGIGLATARVALKHGARVFGVDISAPPTELEGHDRFRALQTDLTAPGAAEETIQQAQKHFGPHIAVLANVADVMDNFGSLDSLTDNMLARCLAVNVTAPIMLSRAVLDSMRQHGSGSIVNVTSKAGISGACSGVAYTTSKHAIVGATRQIAWRYKDEGIRCNAVAPGGVATGGTANIDFSKIDRAGYATLHPVVKVHNPDVTKGMPIEPTDIAEAICFLASDHSRNINGVVLPVDNAWCTI